MGEWSAVNYADAPLLSPITFAFLAVIEFGIMSLLELKNIVEESL